LDFADLHLHSRYSDGEWSPEKLVRAAAKIGLGAIALTDHDDVRGLAEATSAGREHGVEILAGVELSTWWEGVDLHLLGYGFDPEDAPLCRLLEQARNGRLARAERIAERLAELGVPIRMDSVLAIAGPGAVGRPHLARALMEAGHVPTMRAAFDLYLGDGKPACLDKLHLEPGDAVRAIHDAGGVAIVAHPVVLKGTADLERLLPLGLDGVEVRHRLHGRNAEAAFDVEHGLLRTGGSDFHGPRLGGLGVGGVAIPREWWDDLGRAVEERRRGAALSRTRGGRSGDGG
jgi:3',5'-nucleoside bisphosphate phosphatase